MLKDLFPHKIVWLASYPKSGNTWFRAFLAALMNDGNVELNDLHTDGIFSSREIFDYIAEISSRDLYDEEAKLMIADVFRYLAAEKNSLSIIKVHDAFECDEEGNSIIPEEVTHCAIYFVRNPLDIAGSIANHMQFSIAQAVNLLNNHDACMVGQKGNLNINQQFRQHVSDWSSHVKSWTSRPSFPVHVLRYEDMLKDPFESFSRVLKLVGWQYPSEQIKNAIAATSFEKLSTQEAANGFKEKGRMPKFFRKGTAENWKQELTAEQVEKIISCHRDTLIKYNYL